MTSKERVQAALKRQPVDRAPIFMWFHPDTARRLGRVLEIPPAAVAEVMGNDVRQTWVNNNQAMEGVCHERDGDSHTDAWGIEWVKDGAFNQIRRSPLQNADDDEMLAYEFPWARADELLAAMNGVIAGGGDLFIGCDVSPCVFELVCRVRGMENTLLDLAGNPPLADRMLEKAGAFSVRLSEEACRRFPLDWLWTGDDVGSQTGMMMSPACWRERIRPRLAEVAAVGKAHGLWTAYHSCGAIRPIIPDLIKMGIDVLNPIQCNCPGMNPLELKRDFGRDLAFMGGVDTQELLPRGTASQVYRETVRLLDGMTAGGGGYILAASHTVPPETPLDNIWALYEAAGVARQAILDRAAAFRARSIANT